MGSIKIPIFCNFTECKTRRMAMEFFIHLLLMIPIFSTSSVPNSEIDKINTRFASLEQEIQSLRQKISSIFEYCQLQPDDICGPCICSDDDRLLKKYYCDCQNLQPKRDCLEFRQYGIKINGIYKVHQNIFKIIQVYCDQEKDGGGWTVIQRRNDGSVNFYRNWESYKRGFGQLQNEFWLGNENIFAMSLQGLYPRGSELRIDLTNSKNVIRYAKYKKFQIGNADTNYMLHVGDFTGTVTDELKAHNLKMFSTYDKDNDDYSRSCATLHNGGGWWFSGCYRVNLNGLYYPGGDMKIRTSLNSIDSSFETGIHWFTPNFNSDGGESLIYTEMLLRRRL